jgi:hypothetical protein
MALAAFERVITFDFICASTAFSFAQELLPNSSKISLVHLFKPLRMNGNVTLIGQFL